MFLFVLSFWIFLLLQLLLLLFVSTDFLVILLLFMIIAKLFLLLLPKPFDNFLHQYSLKDLLLLLLGLLRCYFSDFSDLSELGYTGLIWVQVKWFCQGCWFFKHILLLDNFFIAWLMRRSLCHYIINFSLDSLQHFHRLHVFLFFLFRI